ncbi:MAG: ExbD/TolR family protein [Planctomycetota bacterium]|jgi:biopolymer transport protein ExbD
MRLLVALLGVAAIAVAGDEAKEKNNKPPPLLRIDAAVQLPKAAHGLPDKGGWGVIVNLNAQGQLSAGDKRCTLDELGKIVDAEGKKSLDGKVSTMRVLLRVDRAAPWQHAQWLMISCALKKVSRVEWAVRLAGDKPGYIKCWLPTDPGIGERETMHFRVHVVARAEKAALFGELKVNKPTQFIYTFGQEQTKELKQVAARIALQKRKSQTAKLSLESEIRAGHKVPVGRIVAVLDQFHASKIESVNFYGAQLPTAEELAAKTLPYPKKNY